MTASLQIIGHGLAGAILAETASAAGLRVRVWDNEGPSASRVAAGLFTPLTGLRLAPTWAAAEALPVLHRFYPALENVLGIRCFHPLPTLRLFTSAEQAAEWSARPPVPGVQPVLPPEPLHAPHGAIRIDGSGWVDVPLLLDALRARREARGEWGQDPDAELRIDATGAAATTHPLWREAGWRNAHGEVLTLAEPLPFSPVTAILNFGKFLLPLGGGRFRLGATYRWDLLDPVPTPEGRRELLEALSEVAPHAKPVVTDHRAGIRPVALARVPIIGPHPDDPREWIFNGFGSKGVLYAPWMAERAVAFLRAGIPLPPETWAPRRILRQRARA